VNEVDGNGRSVQDDADQGAAPYQQPLASVEVVEFCGEWRAGATVIESGLVTAKLCVLAIYDQCQRPADVRACTG
jgi:hypothetical protein